MPFLGSDDFIDIQLVHKPPDYAAVGMAQQDQCIIYEE